MLQARFKKFLLGIASLAALALLPSVASAATLFISPAMTHVSVGGIVTVNLEVNTAGQAINNASATIQFPPDLLQVLSVSKSPSIFSLWVQDPSFSNSDGTITFNGGVPNPGYTGANGQIISITFEAKQAGDASVLFGDSSVLANDGLGTDVLTTKTGADIVVAAAPTQTTTTATQSAAVEAGAPKAPIITSSSNPDQNAWYSDSSPSFSWQVPTDVTSVRMEYDNDPVATPSVTYNHAVSQKTLSDLSDGVYYFHVQLENSVGWGAVANYKFNIDTVAPNPFTVTEANPQDTFNPQPALSFHTTDSGSGMDHYTIKMGDARFVTIPAAEITASAPYIPPVQGPGMETVIVNAYDKAGNVTTATTNIDIAAIDSPTITEAPSTIKQDSPLTIAGTSYPNSTVTVTIKDQNGGQVTGTSQTDASGNFTLVWSHQLDQGTYTMSATVTNAQGAVSLPSPSMTLIVTPSTADQVGSFIISYLSLALILIFALALIIAAILFSYYKLAAFRRRIRKTVRETEQSVHDRFDQLERDIAEQLGILEALKHKRELTKEEKSMVAMFQKYIGAAEKDIDAKLDKLNK